MAHKKWRSGHPLSSKITMALKSLKSTSVQLLAYWTRKGQTIYLTAGMPTRSHSPLLVYLPRSPDDSRFMRSIWKPSYVHEPNLSGQRCSSKGKNVTSIRHELFVMAGMTHNTRRQNALWLRHYPHLAQLTTLRASIGEISHSRPFQVATCVVQRDDPQHFTLRGNNCSRLWEHLCRWFCLVHTVIII